MRRVLLTGASGFVGGAILTTLLARGYSVSLLSRRRIEAPSHVKQILTGDFETLDSAAARAAIAGHEAVIHAAGHAHAEDHSGGDLHRRINRDASILLAQAAAGEGAHFVYLSSIKAQLGANASGHVREDDPPAPEDAYGKAKLAAEHAIRAALPGQHTIIRPVLVCGVGARGNLAALLRLAALPIPLPFGAIAAPRSLISSEDLAAIAVNALETPALSGKTLIAADPAPLTLAQMIIHLRAGLGRKPGLLPVPPWLIGAALRALGRHETGRRLLSPLQAEPSSLLALGWQPTVPAALALERMTRQSLRQD